jgi:hypothetical protein
MAHDQEGIQIGEAMSVLGHVAVLTPKLQLVRPRLLA